MRRGQSKAVISAVKKPNKARSAMSELLSKENRIYSAPERRDMPSRDGSAARTARRISAIDTLSEAARLSRSSNERGTNAARRGAAENLRRGVSPARVKTPAASQQQRGDALRTDAAVSDISAPAVNTAASAGYVGSEMSAQRSGAADNMPVSHSRAVASRQRANSAAVSPAASNEARKASDTAVFDAVNEGAKNVSTPSVGTSGSGSAVSAKISGMFSSAASKAKSANRKKIVRFAAAAVAALLLCAGITVSAVVLSSRNRAKPISADSVLGAAVVLDETDVPEASAADIGVLKASSDAAEPDRYTVKFSFYDKPEVVCSTKGRALGELVGLLGIELSDAQKTEADLSSFIDGDVNVAVDSVTYGTATSEESIDYETKYVDVDTIPRGSTRVQQAGSEGVRTVTYNVTYVNGVETAREKSGEYVSRQPTDRVIARGTGGTAVIGGVPSSYSYVLICDSTVYTGGGITASGLPATEQVIAVDPTVIPLGTKVYIEGIGYRIAADTGGLIKGNFIDIYYETSNPNFAGYGRRNVKVYILD